MTLHSTTASDATIPELLATIAELRAQVARLQRNPELGMLNAAGLAEAIRALPEGRYVVIFCDIDKMKAINTATGSHFATNRYLRRGLKVRAGEIAGQLFGDEFIFILREPSRGRRTDVAAFAARISRQLASQPLKAHERASLASAFGCAPEEVRLSATFAHRAGLRPSKIADAIEALSGRVLDTKSGKVGSNAQ